MAGFDRLLRCLISRLHCTRLVRSGDSRTGPPLLGACQVDPDFCTVALVLIMFTSVPIRAIVRIIIEVGKSVNLSLLEDGAKYPEDTQKTEPP